MSKRISIYDFSFLPSGYGHYKVFYRSPKTGKEWWATTSNMELIDATKNTETEDIKVKDLVALKRIAKRISNY